MKKMFVCVLVVSSMALAACGKKKAPDAPTGGSAAGSDMGSAAGSGDMGSAAGSGDAPAGGGSAM